MTTIKTPRKKKRISKNTAYKQEPVKKICGFCKKEFECTYRPERRKYCSEYCRDRKSLLRPERKEYEKQYREKNRDRIHKVQKECYEKNKDYYITKQRRYSELHPTDPSERLRVFHYKGKTIRFYFDIRCGVCNLCRAVEKIDTYSTQRHHDNDIYYDDNPLQNTIELCVNCHAIETFNKVRSVQKKSNKKKE